MNRKDIQELRIHTGYPAITLILPCDKKLVQDALINVLNQLKDDPFATAIKEKSSEFLNNFMCPVKKMKTALFIDKHGARSFVVPASTPDIISCDTAFKLDIITQKLNHTFRYWVIDCTTQLPTIFEGMEDIINPLQGTCSVFTDEECKLEHNKNRCFDTCVNSYLEQDQLPICIVGDTQQTLRLRLIAPYAERVVVRVKSHEDIWPAMHRWHATEVEKLLKRIGNGIEQRDYFIDIHEIITYARQGLVSQLVIEEGYARTGCEHPVTRAIIFNKSCPHDYFQISVIDQIIEAVRSKGGEILIIPDGSITTFGRMIAFVSHIE